MTDDVPLAEPANRPGFVDFYRDQYTKTVRLAGFLSGDRASAEDLAQDAFSRVHARFAELDNPAGYLRTTLVNLCRNRRRTVSRESKHLTRHGLSPVAVSDRAAELDATLHRLPYEERAVVVLRYWLGLSEAQIAEHLSCRPGTVKSRGVRALKKIRKELS